MTDVREMTLSPGICASCSMISAVIPSLKYSFAESPLKSWNGRTATDAA